MILLRFFFLRLLLCPLVVSRSVLALNCLWKPIQHSLSARCVVCSLPGNSVQMVGFVQDLWVCSVFKILGCVRDSCLGASGTPFSPDHPSAAPTFTQITLLSTAQHLAQVFPSPARHSNVFVPSLEVLSLNVGGGCEGRGAQM